MNAAPNFQSPTPNFQDARRCFLAVGVWKLAVVAIAIATAACSKQTAEETESEAPVPVKVEGARIGAIRAVLHATGIINPAPEGEMIVIAPEAGRIIEITRAEGERVAKGDVLVR